MSTITVRLNSEEARIYKEYAKFKNIPLSHLLGQNGQGVQKSDFG